MRIVALDLENTKNYNIARIDFTDGVNAIVGHNGAGKSTILEAIGFALFDCLVGYKQTEFVREGAKSATITVTFESGRDERAYQVVRRCGSSNQYYVYDPDLSAKICEGKTDVLNFLRQQMGVEPAADLARLFSDAVGVPQGTFTAAFLQTPAQRKVIFDPLLQVEEYKEAVDKLLPPTQLLKERRQTAEVEIARLEARLEGLPALEALLAERWQQQATAEQEVATVGHRLQLVTATRAALESVRQDLAMLQNQVQQADQQCFALRDQLQRAQLAQQEAEEAVRIVAANQDGYARYLQAQEEQQVLDAQQRQRATAEKEFAQLDKALSLQQSEAATLERELAQMTTAAETVRQLEPAVQEQTRLETEVANAQQAQARLQDAQTQLQQQSAACRQLEERLQRLTEQLTQAGQITTEHSALEQSLETVRQQIDQSKETLARFKVEADALKQQNSTLAEVASARCPICEQPLTAEHRHHLLQRNEVQLEELRAHYKEQQQQIKRAEDGQKAQQEELKQLEQRLRKLPREREKGELQQQIVSAQATLVQTQERMTTLSASPQLLAELQKQLATLGNPRQQSAIAKATLERCAQLLDKQAQVAREIARRQEQLTEIQHTLAQFSNLNSELERVNRTLQASKVAYQAVLIHQKSADACADRTADVARLQDLLATATTEQQRRRMTLAERTANFDEEEYQRLIFDEQTLRSRQGSLQAQIAMWQQEIERAAQELGELRIQADKLAAALCDRAALERQSSALETMRGLLRQAGPYITKALIKQISDGAAQIFSDIMQDYTRHLRWHEDYGVTLEVDGRERHFAQLSGGEQMSAALSIRLALLREMSNIDIAFFDEPTANLDEMRRGSLARQILDVKGFRQLFVISHDDTFEQATQNLIRVARVDGVSVVLQE
ncbi:MAG: SMC family ATPase [Caldilineaceae bacterium]